MERSFKIDRQDIYSFLTTDVAKAFECIFEFDTINHRINIYKESTVGEDTNIHISYANLAKSANISASTDNIKTCLTVTGADNLGIREVNMGIDRIYNIDYFHSLDYMSSELYEAYKVWKNLWNSKAVEYEGLMLQYQSYYNDIYYLQSEKMPDDPNSKTWSEYGLNPLKEKLSAYEAQQAVMIKAGQAEASHKDYETMYLPVYNTIEEVKAQIAIVKSEIDALNSKQMAIGEQMDSICSLVSIENNFTEEQWSELSKFIREDELSDDNFVVTDVDTDSERMDTLRDLLKHGQKELAKFAVPTMQFSMDMVNIYAIPEFKDNIDKFHVGNYIYVTLRDGFSLKLRLLEIDVNFYDVNDFSVTYGNVAKLKGSKLFEDITNALSLASSAATSVSFNSSHWNKANVESTNIGMMLSEGLLSSGKRLATTKSDVVIDDRGVFIGNNPNNEYANDVIFLGGGQMVFSDDGLKTIKTALGRVEYTKNGVTYNDFGLLAQFVIAGYIAGSIIEGNEIIAGSITGTEINNGNGTFSVDEEGNLIAKNATITGTINAEKGYIGGSNGFTIESGKLYSGTKSSFDDVDSGVYIGADGISLGKDNPFSVTQDGVITANNGNIGGAKITKTSIEASNGNWKLNDTGFAEFKGAYIGGVAVNSSFGGITYDSNGTLGSFNNGFSAGTSFGLSGGALTNFNSLVVKNITADNIRATDVLAGYVETSTLTANYATISSLDSATARIGIIESNYVKAGTIDANDINTGTVNGNEVKWQGFNYVSSITPNYGNGDGYVTSISVTSKYLYSLCAIKDY